MRIHKLLIALLFCFITGKSFAQNGEGYTGKYKKFAIYAGAGPSYFINNVETFKDDVSSFKYAISARFMWEPEHSFVSLGFETGYYNLYSAKSTNPRGEVSNTCVPLLFVASMKFSKKFYANWSMGQSLNYNNISNTDSSKYNFNSSYLSPSDFAVTFIYRLVQKPTISYNIELKGFYSSKYENATIALLFIVGFRL